MKREVLLKSMSEISPEFVEDAAPGKRRKRKISWMKWGAAAACLCLAAVGTAFFLRERHEEPRWPVYEVTVGGTYEEATVADTAIAKTWEEKSLSERFGGMSFEGREYGCSRRDTALDAADVGALLGECTLEGYDWMSDTEHSINAEVFAVRGISSECAVAIRFEGEDECYAYVNSWYTPETLGDFIDDLSLEENLVCGGAEYVWRKEDGSVSWVNFEDFDDSAVWDMLLDDRTIPEAGFDARSYTTILSISIDCSLLGYENVTLSIAEGGYVWTNLLDTGKAFYLGEEKTGVFVEWVLYRVDGVEIVTVYAVTQNDGGETESVPPENTAVETTAVFSEAQKGAVTAAENGGESPAEDTDAVVMTTGDGTDTGAGTETDSPEHAGSIVSAVTIED